MKKTFLLLITSIALLSACTQTEDPRPVAEDPVTLDNDIIESESFPGGNMMTIYRVMKGGRGAFVIYGYYRESPTPGKYVLREISADGSTLWETGTGMTVSDIGYYYNNNGTIAGYVVVGYNNDQLSLTNVGEIRTFDAFQGVQKDNYFQYDANCGLRLSSLVKLPTDACGNTDYYGLGSAYFNNTLYPFSCVFNIDNYGNIKEATSCTATPYHSGIDSLQPDKFYAACLRQDNYEIALLTGSGPLRDKSFLQRTHIRSGFTADWELTHNALYRSPTLVSDDQGNYYIAGSLQDKAAPRDTTYWQDAVISKFSANGSELWTKTLSGKGKTKYDDVFCSVIVEGDKVYAAGRTRFVGTEEQPIGNALLTIFNTNGDVAGCYETGSTKGHSGFNACLSYYQKRYYFGFKEGTTFYQSNAWIAQLKL